MSKLKTPSICLWLISQVLHSTYCLKEKKTTSTMKEGCLKTTQLSPNKTINPHPTTLPQSNFTLLPELKNSSKINLDPIKDSALNIISLNIRSLTIKEDSVKLKRIFKLDAAIIVLTEVSVNGSAFSKLCRLWREQISRYQVWYTGTDYRGIMILVKKIVAVTLKMSIELLMMLSLLTSPSLVEQ